MSRSDRLRDLMRLITDGSASSQQVIVEALTSMGHEVTQATVSRDLREIGAVKARVGGSASYRLPDHLPQGDHDHAARALERNLREYALTLDISGSMLVVRTPPGHAQLLARAIDLSEQDEVIGTVAGDDTIFVATPDADAAQRLKASWSAGRDWRTAQ